MIQTVELDGYRFYHINGEYYPSVTSILSIKYNPTLVRWKKRYSSEIIKAILDYTGKRGELIHYITLKYYETDSITQGEPPAEAMKIAEKNPKMINEIEIALKLFRDFKKYYHLEAVALEKVVWNDQHQFAGRVDFVGFLIDPNTGFKTKVLVDIKTSKMVYTDSVSLQLSAYNYCLNNWGAKIYCLLLHTGPTTVKNVSIGAEKAYWDFKELTPNIKSFLRHNTQFKPIASQILQTHGF